MSPEFDYYKAKEPTLVDKLRKDLDILQGRLIFTARRDAETIRALREELNNILNAKPHEWDDPSDFVNWAKNRARHALQKIENS